MDANIARRDIRRFVLAVVIVTVAVGWATGSPLAGMVAVVIGSWIAIAFLVWDNRTRSPWRAGFSWHLRTAALLYLVPVTIALTAHMLLALLVLVGGDFMSLRDVVHVQREFERLSEFFSSYMTLSAGQVLWLLVLVWVLGALASAYKESRSAGAGYRAIGLYVRYTAPIAAGLGVLAGVTVLGTQFDRPAAMLQAKTDAIHKGYADIQRDLRQQINSRVAAKLYPAFVAELPESSRKGTGAQQSVDQWVETTRGTAQDAYLEDEIQDSRVRTLITSEDQRDMKVRALDTDLRTRVSPVNVEPSPDVTYRQIKATTETLDSWTATHEKPRVTIWREGHKQVTLQVLSVVSERIVAATRPLTETVPLLEPAIDAFADAVVNTARERLGRAYDQVAAQALDHPNQIGRLVDQAAERVAGNPSTAAEIRDAATRARPETVERYEQLRRKADELEAGRDRLQEKVRTSESHQDWLLRHAGKPFEDVIIEPISKLVRTPSGEWRTVKVGRREKIVDYIDIPPDPNETSPSLSDEERARLVEQRWYEAQGLNRPVETPGYAEPAPPSYLRLPAPAAGTGLGPGGLRAPGLEPPKLSELPKPPRVRAPAPRVPRIFIP